MATAMSSSTISQSLRELLTVPTKGFMIDSSLSYTSKKGNFSKIEAIAFSYNTLLSPSKIIPNNSHKKSNEASLILIRHGESLWNETNLFTGCIDVPLTEKGVEEAIEAGKRISNIHVDVIFTSSLIRAQMTTMLAMIQHRRKKVWRIGTFENPQILRLVGNVDGLYNSLVSDIGLMILAQGCKRLVKLELAGCEGGFVGIKEIGECCQMLEELTVCDRVISECFS